MKPQKYVTHNFSFIYTLSYKQIYQTRSSIIWKQLNNIIEFIQH